MHTLAGEQRPPDALGAVFEEHREDVIGSHQRDGAPTEIGHVAREWERREVCHRIRLFTGEMRS
jgi:hypothetical protein